MTTTARRLRALLRSLLVATVLVAAGGPSAPDVAAVSLPVRLEAGPQTGVTFDRSWRVTSRTTVTLAAPRDLTATARRSEPPGGTWLRLAGGPLDGRWVRESAVAHVAGFAGTTGWPAGRSVTLGAGTWELYRFAGDGTLAEARARRLSRATTVTVDRVSIVRGLKHVRVADGAWAGWWIPGSRANPDPVRCSVGSPPDPGSPIVVRAVAGATREIALTFDLGGRTLPALSILRSLELRRVCATIFPTGETAATPEGAAILAEIAAHPELFEVGNHTLRHCNLRDGGGPAGCPATRPSAAFVRAELRDADAIIAPLAGSPTAPWWRPPYGAVDRAIRLAAADAGYPVTVMWSTDTIDWRRVRDGGPTAAEIAATVVAQRTAGGVVLMHLGGWRTLDSLPAMVAGLRAAGYAPTSVSALFRAGS
jgi:peptidoglycan/xylan/chitin deacetylase (PgdA/CDA1 family)